MKAIIEVRYSGTEEIEVEIPEGDVFPNNGQIGEILVERRGTNPNAEVRLASWRLKHVE